MPGASHRLQYIQQLGGCSVPVIVLVQLPVLLPMQAQCAALALQRCARRAVSHAWPRRRCCRSRSCHNCCRPCLPRPCLRRWRPCRRFLPAGRGSCHLLAAHPPLPSWLAGCWSAGTMTCLWRMPPGLWASLSQTTMCATCASAGESATRPVSAWAARQFLRRDQSSACPPSRPVPLSCTTTHCLLFSSLPMPFKAFESPLLWAESSP